MLVCKCKLLECTLTSCPPHSQRRTLPQINVFIGEVEDMLKLLNTEVALKRTPKLLNLN
jgi:hypothetical protein